MAKPSPSARLRAAILASGVHAALTADHPSEVRYYARGVGLLKEQGAKGAVELAGVR